MLRALARAACVRRARVAQRVHASQSRYNSHPSAIYLPNSAACASVPTSLPNNLAVAPMAGVTDRPFRQLCKRLGAGYAVSEMVASNPRLWGTDKSRRRTDHAGEVAPIAVQIAGADPAMMADAARYNVDRGAQIIDINMGCPAKKVCNAAAGSALLANEPLVARDPRRRRAPRSTCRSRSRSAPARIRATRNARRASRASPRTPASRRSPVHGRTRACAFVGAVEYDTIARGQARGAHPGDRQRRHRHAASARGAVLALHRRRRR